MLNNPTITNDTRFKNLPMDLKNRILTINNKIKTHPQNIQIHSLNVNKLNDINNLIVNNEMSNLNHNYRKLVQIIEELKENKEGNVITNHLSMNNTLDELRNLVFLLKTDDKEPLNNLLECIKLMTGKLDEYKRKKEKNM